MASLKFSTHAGMHIANFKRGCARIHMQHRTNWLGQASVPHNPSAIK
jgi:hypothetical protein